MQIKQTKDQLVSLAEKIKGYIKPALYVIGSLALLYGLVYILTKKEQMPAELQATIDSLNKANIELVLHQKQIDSIIKLYDIQIKQVDDKISNLKEKTTIIREYYHEQSQATDKYTPTQVDSFFKQRYNY